MKNGFLTTVTFLLVFYCSNSFGLDSVSLQLRWKHQFQFAGYYMALEKGFYQKAGLDVTLIEGGPHATSPMQHVLDGKNEFAVTSSGVVIQRMEGKPVVVTAAIFQTSPEVWISLADSKISLPHHLLGKTAAILPAPESAELLTIFKNEGLDYKQVNLVDHVFDISDLIEGKIDVYDGYISNEPYLLTQQDISYNIINPSDYGVNFYGDVLATSEAFANSNPELVKRFTEASIRGWYYALEHKEETIKLIKRKYAPDKSLNHLRYEANSIERLVMADMVQIGHMNPGRWRYIANSYKELNMTNGKEGLNGFLFRAVNKTDHSAAIYLTLLFSLILFVVLIITARFVKLSEKLKLANEQLGMAMKQTEEANMAKSRFLANMSHEIRTPLTTIIGYADAVINKDITRESQFAVMKKVSASGNHLLGLINNILDFSKIEAGQLTIEKRYVDLADLLIETNQLALELVKDKPLLFQVIFTTSVPSHIHTDPIRLKQVLINLISNAVKFTKAGQIKLLISVESENIVFSVKDTGIGIAEEDLETLFVAFKQRDASTTREFGGAGLGLSISQSIANNFLGDIRVESIEGEGATFTFSMKLEVLDGCEWITSLPGTRSDQQLISSHDSISGKVLLAEDNDENRQLIQIILENLGLEVETVINGQDAVEACLTQHFQLILMDIQMPHLDGLGAIRLIKGTGVEVPILAVTANVTTQDIELYKKSGFADCIAKPIERKKLIASIKKYILVEEQEEDIVIDEFAELQKQYRESFNEIVSSLEESLANNEVAAIGKLAHKVKGAAPTFGYQLIGEKAADLDAAIKQQEPSIHSIAEELLTLLKTAR